jgi:hypothetical protein
MSCVRTKRRYRRLTGFVFQHDWVIYTDDVDGSSILWPGSGGDEDLGIQKGWKYLGANYKEAELL